MLEKVERGRKSKVKRTEGQECVRKRKGGGIGEREGRTPRVKGGGEEGGRLSQSAPGSTEFTFQVGKAGIVFGA